MSANKSMFLTSILNSNLRIYSPNPFPARCFNTFAISKVLLTLRLERVGVQVETFSQSSNNTSNPHHSQNSNTTGKLQE